MKEFNTTGLCISKEHYMVDVSNKMKKIIRLVQTGKYFTINRSRQFGKTTTLSLLKEFLEKEKEAYLVIETSFEGLGEYAFSTELNFCTTFTTLINRRLEHEGVDKKIIRQWNENVEDLDSLNKLSEKITKLVENVDKDVVLMIDEVDKASNNKLFLHFLGMLRNKYLDRGKGYDKTFKSVILAGVRDIRNLKSQIRSDEKTLYNSPWNIATDFKVDLSFNPQEISTMLVEYEKDHHTGMDITKISDEIYKYTNGYPFLVSKVCKIIDEDLDKKWDLEGVEESVKLLLEDKNTLFDDLIKNLENNEDMYKLIYRILIDLQKIDFNHHNPIISKGLMYGILTPKDRKVSISNKIFEVCIYNYMISKKQTSENNIFSYKYKDNYIVDGDLNLEKVLRKFQELMYSEYRERDDKFIEREGRLLFLCFLKPIINGEGFYYVESETRMDNRMDIVVTYNKKQYIIELKIWHGENYEKEALQQLSTYLDSKHEKTGFLVSFSFNKNKQYTKEWKKHKDKDIFAIVV